MRTLVALILLGLAGHASAQYCGAYQTTVTTLQAGGRVDWARSHGLIAYDRAPQTNAYFDVHVRSLDGSVNYCLTCDATVRQLADLRKNKGNPAWHPSGDYIVFQSEIDTSDVAPNVSSPGRGVNNVLWLTDARGTRFTPLTSASADTPATGVLHPHFSEDGARLSWTEMYEPFSPVIPGKMFGYWRLKSARFVTGDGGPRLEDIETYQPMVEGFYENHGFSPDGALLLFSSNAARSGYLDRLNADIFTLDLASGALVRLTDSGYNEHASYFPGARRILWMSNRGNLQRGTDLWVMDAPDGMRPERLSFFNRRGCPEAYPDRAVVADSSINAAGDKVVVYVQDELLGYAGSIVLVELPFPF